MKLAVLAVVLVATPAWAQSNRYPPNPIDKERETEAESKLWEQALDPARAPYDQAIRSANVLIGKPQNENLLDAIRILDQAISTMPDRPEGYRARGEAQLLLKHWAQCADDLQVAESRSPRTDARSPRIAERRSLGICQAHAGRLGDAERTLAQAAATGARDGELWIRLGEVRIAMGKLEEGKAALASAAEVTDTNSQGLIHWLLAGAYDRAREPGNALLEVQEAAKTDHAFSLLSSTPFISDGESEYLFALVYGAELAGQVRRPELQMQYFKRFLKVAPQSPWRRRAEEHLRDLKDVVLPDVVEKLGGNAAVDTTVARGAIRAVMPRMRACLAKAPNLILEVIVTRVGTHDPHGMSPLPPPPIPSIVPRANFDVAPAERDPAVRCVDALLPQIALPAVKEPDHYYKLDFLVIAP
ncbi:MAG TPA: hypothetical protein VGO00_18240 [Kofleriaceae bacterium]|nr:hypothetical protein [Kofleriaceae bacterium]